MERSPKIKIYKEDCDNCNDSTIVLTIVLSSLLTNEDLIVMYTGTICEEHEDDDFLDLITSAAERLNINLIHANCNIHKMLLT